MRRPCFVSIWSLVCVSAAATAYPQAPETPAAPAPAAPTRQPVVIERMPLQLRDPQTYRASLHLEPVRSLTITARIDGVVDTVTAKVGEQVAAQAELLRLDTTLRRLKLDRAKAALQAAQADQQAAAAPAKGAADARMEVARIDVQIAEHQLEQTTLRAPFDGSILRIHVSAGEFVRVGQPLLTIVDPSRLMVELPVDRKTAKVGETMEIKIEDATAPATIETVLPAIPAFEPLRELFVSIGTATAVVDNSTGRWNIGQTVYSSLIPRLPVAELPTAAVSNSGDGARKVQVIREGFVRDVPLEVLGQVGADHVFVSGRFSDQDELVLKSSSELLDGTRVVAATESATAEQGGQTPPAGGVTPAAPAQRAGGF